MNNDAQNRLIQKILLLNEHESKNTLITLMNITKRCFPECSSSQIMIDHLELIINPVERCYHSFNDDIYHWIVKIDQLNYFQNTGGLVEIIFPKEYPVIPPKIKFISTIVHPFVIEGVPVLPLLDKNNWVPSTKIINILSQLIDILSCYHKD